MAARTDRLLVGVFSVVAFCIFSWKYSIIGVNDALQLAGRGLLLFAVAVWMVSFLYPKLKSFLFPAGPETLEIDEAHSREKQEQARREQQQQHMVKSSQYEEAVLKPRLEARRRKKIEDCYRISGETWKLSEGFPLGGDGEIEANADMEDDETPSQKAARKRKQLVTQQHAPVQKEQHKEKKIIILPEEPPDNAEGVVKIALKCPSGRTVQRRFYKSCKSSVLLDWLHKSGYSPTIYTLFTSYPRRPLVTHTDLTLEDVGINVDTALNVGEKDPSTT